MKIISGKIYFRILTIFLAFFLVFGVVNSADNYFKVISVKGIAEVQKNAKGKWEKVKISQKIASADKIKLSEGAALNLVHNEGKTIFLNTAKEYSTAQLLKMATKKADGVSSKLARAVVDDINKADNMLSSDNYKSQSSLTGAGVRGLYGVKAKSPRKIHYSSPEVSFTWYSAYQGANYKFIITSIDNTPLYSVSTKDTTLKLNINDINLQRDVYYFWYVSAEGDTHKRPDNYSFKVLPENRVSLIRDSINTIQKELSADDPAFREIVLARFYEGNYLIENARQSYNKAIELAPDVETYLEIYKMFIENNFSSR